MYKGYDEQIKPEAIILSNLKNYAKKGKEYYSFWHMQLKKEEENANKTEDEINAEIIKEIKNNMNKLKKENTKYYQIDDAKNAELKAKFNQIRLKINFPSKVRILRADKFYTIIHIHTDFIIFKGNLYNKLFFIKIEGYDKNFSVIELDNEDLVFLIKDQIMIYRLKDEEYSLIQKISETRVGYGKQMSCSGCYVYPKTYEALYIKEISGNRFICVSNYGFKIFALNNKNEYSLVLIEIYHDSIKKIYELNKDNFIFCSQINCEASLGAIEHNILIIDRIQLKEISQNEKEEKLREFEHRENDNYYLDERSVKQIDKINENDAKNVIESLKYNCKYNEFFGLEDKGYHFFRGELIIKNKYLLVEIDHNIILFDIYSGKQLKRYEILIEGIDNLYKQIVYIQKWNNDSDNEFFMNIYGIIFLFRLTGENNLIIVATFCSKYLVNYTKFDENNNIFYSNAFVENTGNINNQQLLDSFYKEIDKGKSVYIF